MKDVPRLGLEAGDIRGQGQCCPRSCLQRSAQGSLASCCFLSGSFMEREFAYYDLDLFKAYSLMVLLYSQVVVLGSSRETEPIEGAYVCTDKEIYSCEELTHLILEVGKCQDSQSKSAGWRLGRARDVAPVST